jgi:GTP-binding protein Era
VTDPNQADDTQKPEFHSGFVTIVGRPNVGKSTLLNRILGQKVSIVSNKPQTTRTQVRGVLTRPDSQIVFIDTPGIHKPKTALGSRLNDTAHSAVGDVDLVVFMIDASKPFGRGDEWIADRIPRDAVLVVNKLDKVPRETILDQLHATSPRGFSAYFPVSAQTGKGVDELVEYLISKMPVGPQYYPTEMVTDCEDAFWVGELVREQLFAILGEELPYSVACVVTEWEWPRIRCEIAVERDSQKGIVIGKGGLVLKQVGTAVRAQLPEGAFLELFVRVDPNWQRSPKALERLGY